MFLDTSVFLLKFLCVSCVFLDYRLACLILHNVFAACFFCTYIISLPFPRLGSMWSVFFIYHWRCCYTLPSFHFFVSCCCVRPLLLPWLIWFSCIGFASASCSSCRYCGFAARVGGWAPKTHNHHCFVFCFFWFCCLVLVMVMVMMMMMMMTTTLLLGCFCRCCSLCPSSFYYSCSCCSSWWYYVIVFLPQGVLPFDSDAFVNYVFILSSSNGHRRQNWQQNKINNKLTRYDSA